METMSKNRPARMQEIPRLTDDMGQTHPTINAIRDKCKEVDKRDDPNYVLSFADSLMLLATLPKWQQLATVRRHKTLL